MRLFVYGYVICFTVTAVGTLVARVTSVRIELGVELIYAILLLYVLAYAAIIAGPLTRILLEHLVPDAIEELAIGQLVANLEMAAYAQRSVLDRVISAALLNRLNVASERVLRVLLAGVCALLLSATLQWVPLEEWTDIPALAGEPAAFALEIAKLYAVHLFASHCLLQMVLQLLVLVQGSHLGHGAGLALKRCTTPTLAHSSPSCVSILHLSDLHLTEGDGIPRLGVFGPPGGNRAFRRIMNRIEAESPQPDVLLVTGDITDSGRPGEWAAFVDSLPATLRDRTIVVPGNHDVNILGPSIWWTETPEFEARGYRLLRALRWMAEVQGRRAWVYELGQPIRLDEWLGVCTPYARGESAERCWERAFPMVLEVGDVAFFVLNSSARSSHLASNAFGWVAEEQLERLRLLQRHFRDRRHVFAMHHHLAAPRELRPLQHRFLVLENAPQLAEAIADSGRPVVVFHGHQHLDYEGTWRNLHIISAPSSTLANGGPLAYRCRLAPSGPLGLRVAERQPLGRGEASGLPE